MTTANATLDRVRVGDVVPPLHFLPTVAQTALTPAATFDSYPVHYNLEFARSLGLPHMFLNSMPILGPADRLVTDWAGPGVFVVNHEVAIKQSLYIEVPILIEGTVVRVESLPVRYERLLCGSLVGVDVCVIVADAKCVTATISLAMRKVQE